MWAAETLVETQLEEQMLIRLTIEGEKWYWLSFIVDIDVHFSLHEALVQLCLIEDLRRYFPMLL